MAGMSWAGCVFHDYPHDRDSAHNIPLDPDHQKMCPASSDTMKWPVGDPVWQQANYNNLGRRPCPSSRNYTTKSRHSFFGRAYLRLSAAVLILSCLLFDICIGTTLNSKSQQIVQKPRLGEAFPSDMFYVPILVVVHY